MQFKFHFLLLCILSFVSSAVFPQNSNDSGLATEAYQVQENQLLTQENQLTTQGLSQANTQLGQTNTQLGQTNTQLGQANTQLGEANSQLTQTNDQLKKLVSYFVNLGKYLGYDISQYASPSYSQTLLTTPTKYQQLETSLLSNYLGSLMGGGGNNQSSNPLVPDSIPQSTIINGYANQAFTNPSYASPSQQTVSVSDLVDQQTYQADPVSQSVLNILATPSYSYCTYYTNANSGNSTTNSNCPILFREKVMAGIIPQLPNAEDVFSTAYNTPLVPQLNSDVFIVPLLYSTTNNNSNNSQSGSTNALNSSLPASTQAQQAANFVRYAAGTLNPLTLPSQKTYDSLVSTAMNYAGVTNMTSTQVRAQLKAQVTLSNYLIQLRTYAAQTSVGISNLYYILSKRLPQTPPQQGNSQSPPSSAALSEFNMATWRLFNTNSSNSGNNATQQQWLDMINNGSSVSVQKEMAILLAEINYQLYLTRQQNERMLLTQSIILLQNAQTIRPNSELVPESAAQNNWGATGGTYSNGSTGGTAGP